MTSGGATWYYTAEITLDKSMGVCLFVQFVWMMIIVGTFEFALESPIGPHGSFWVFSAIMFVGFIWGMFMLKETRGKTDYQKKTLYSPTSLVLVSGDEDESFN